MIALTKVYRKARGTLILLKSAPGMEHQPESSQVVEIDIRNYLYARYFYSFVKFLRLEGHQVVLRARPETIHLIDRSQYAAAVLSERLVSVGRSSVKDRRLISDGGGGIALAPFDFTPSRDPSIVDVPMAQHPMMYSRGYWNQQVSLSAPRSTILFLGNSSPTLYSQITADGLFDVIDRVALKEIVERLPGCHTAAAGGHVGEVPDSGIRMIDSETSQVSMADFRQVVSRYGFFLCAPGVFMPLCHNVVEAMSVGTVPLIQKAYANLMIPPLTDGVNAVVFNDGHELKKRIMEIQMMPGSCVGRLREGVGHYYESHLTPRAVVGKIFKPGVRGIRILAGDHSLTLLRRAITLVR